MSSGRRYLLVVLGLSCCCPVVVLSCFCVVFVLFLRCFCLVFVLFLSCRVVSCLALSCLVLSCLVLSCLVLSCLGFALFLSCLVLSCPCLLRRSCRIVFAFLNRLYLDRLVRYWIVLAFRSFIVIHCRYIQQILACSSTPNMKTSKQRELFFLP